MDFFFFNFFFDLLTLFNFSNIINFNFFFLYNYFNNFYLFLINLFSTHTNLTFFNMKNFSNNANNTKIVDIFSVENKNSSVSNFSKNHEIFFSKSVSLDYNSYFIYIYTLYNIVFSLPQFFISIFRNFLDLNTLIIFLNNTYTYLFSFYFPSLLSDNAIFYFYQKITHNFFLFESSFFSFSFLSTLSFLNFFYSLSSFHIFLNFFFSNLFFYVNSFFLFIFSNFFNFSSFFSNIFFSTQTNRLFSFFYNFNLFTNSNIVNKNEIINSNYTSNFFANISSSFYTKYFNEENHNNARYLRFYNPVFKYDYKSGDYFPKLYKQVYSYLFTSINDLTNSVRTAP